MKSGMADDPGCAESRSRVLVVVPCGRTKIWDKHPDYGAALARDAYISPTFALNRTYAERFGDQWVILSAKYGFVDSDFPIPGPYDVTFKDRSPNVIDVATLQEQVREQSLDRFGTVVPLGSKVYRRIVERAFSVSRVTVCSPFAGLGIGKYVQAVRQAVDTGKSGIVGR